MVWQSFELRFASDHPSAAGHFPSNPIIPGALLLDEVVKAAAEPANPGSEINVRTAKFFRPVRPGERLSIRWKVSDAGVIEFECRLIDDDALAAAGSLEVGSAPP
jgi:3-hydroxyacyl-[acyl-carrier-protein] dehydratase